MKIGVALSGCDIGGISAWRVLQKLASLGISIDMISVCGVPAVTSLLYADNYPDAAVEKLAEAFLRDRSDSDIDFAIANFAASLKFPYSFTTPITINSVNVSDGRIVAFTDDYSLKGENLRTFNLCDPYDTLSATVGPMDCLGCYRLEDMRLCDFCCWYGCPVHALKLSGCTKVISVAFLPKSPRLPYELHVKQMSCSTALTADVHIPIEFCGCDYSLEEYCKISVAKVESLSKQILLKLLF